MAIKKSELYSSLWKSCDELRDGMDASQYKDYILPLLFIKYVSDKYAGKEDAIVYIPEGASFNDLVRMKGKDGIGDYINKKVLVPIDKENGFGLFTSGKMSADFNDEEKLGKGKELVDKVSKLITIFETPALNFSKNRAEDDDILGDAYEYLMTHFATQSGKSKGQFYTPAEVSRILAKIIGVNENTKQSQSVYDPACGSGSLLLKVADEAPNGLTIYGQEKDNATVALAKMNMVLHNSPEAVQEIIQDNTLSKPYHKDPNTGQLKTFDFCVANPPFSTKSWRTGFNPEDDIFKRFNGFGIPPNKNGDYAFMLHIIKSLKSKGKGAVILPHGVLFRGNAEASIREEIIKRGLIKGIIGLPANLFYGTGIPACIIVIDKENASSRKGIFIIDASKGYLKDGNKNRLREQDLHRIVDVFNKQIEIPKYARMVSIQEIEQNEYNLNIPRYVDRQEIEDLQDIEAHLKGDIPNYDVEDLQRFWEVYSDLKSHLFHPAKRNNYSSLVVPKNSIKETIYNHAQFIEYRNELDKVFSKWEKETHPKLWNFTSGIKPKHFIHDISESLLLHYSNKPLIDKYNVYQHLLDYWLSIMKDDCYWILDEGWKPTLTPVRDSKSKIKKGEFESDFIPFNYVIARYFKEEQNEINQTEAELERLVAEKTELQEEHAGEEDALHNVSSKADATINLKEFFNLYLDKYHPKIHLEFENANEKKIALTVEKNALKKLDELITLENSKGNIVKKAVQEKLKNYEDLPANHPLNLWLQNAKSNTENNKTLKTLNEQIITIISEKIETKSKDEFIFEIGIINQYLDVLEVEAETKKVLKKLETELKQKLYTIYPKLTIEEIKTLVVEDKWLATIKQSIDTEIDHISQRLTNRIKELANRYEKPLPSIEQTVNNLQTKVTGHLQKMGMKW